MRWLSVQRSPKLLASLVCATALACGGGGDDDPQRLDGPAGLADAGTGSGGDAQAAQPGQTAEAGQPTQPGASDAGTMLSVVDAGPPDLGQNSQGDTFFRADTLVLKAPNMYVPVKTLGISLGTQDVTQDGQTELNKALTMDADGDGFVDMSMLIRFLKTSDPKAANGEVTPGGAVCPMPLGPDAACGPDKTFPFQAPPLSYTNSAQACALQGTQESAAGPCFATALASLTMQLPILGAVPLRDGQLVGTWDGANISNGWVRGFLPKTVAAETKLGEGVPELLNLVGVKQGDPLTKFLSESQIQKNNQGEDGWWFLMSYTAKAAKFDPNAKTP